MDGKPGIRTPFLGRSGIANVIHRVSMFDHLYEVAAFPYRGRSQHRLVPLPGQARSVIPARWAGGA